MIRISNLEFRYDQSDFAIRIQSLEVEQGESVAVVGPSGSGKTTLLNLIAGILVPDAGSLQVAGHQIETISDASRRDFRISNIGLIFQSFELLDYLNVRQNILLPYLINRTLHLDAAVEERLDQLAANLGIAQYLRRRIDHLSQGERQRVAVCRALLTSPKVLLADEPTGSLDPNNKTRIVELLAQHSQSAGATLLVVTHDHSLLPHFDRVIEFETLLDRVATKAGQ